MYYKYPKTFHLPWSLGATNDDKILKSIDHLLGKEVVITEKKDGENCNLYCDHIHARSLETPHHPSQNYVKKMW